MTMMNRNEFVAFRNEITEQRDLLRLDCMNPFSAMRYTKNDIAPETVTQAQAVEMWAERMGMQAYQAQAIANPGVRDSLKSLFNLYAAQKRELWLPQDVYPVYWDTAREAGATIRSFPTLPQPDLSPLTQAADTALALITSPVSPLGAPLSDAQTAQFIDWLAASQGRRLILDAVYAYTCGFDRNAHALLETGQCLLAHSLSKAWLERGVFGVLTVPEQDKDDCLAVVRAPLSSSCDAAYTALKHQPDMPLVQQREFDREWERLAPSIRAFAPDFKPPVTGYFAAVSVPYERALDHGALVIPASVFGATRSDVSVVSCLFDIGPG